MKDLLLGVMATLLCLGLIWCKQLDAGKQDKQKIIEVTHGKQNYNQTQM